MKLLREWKKVLESDLDSIITELKDSLESPAIIILTGEMGMGKTTFTKSFVKSELEDTSEIQSPTYSIINESGNIVHADFYRLKNSEDLIHLELPLYLEDKEYFLIEWGKSYLSDVQKLVTEDFFYFEIIITSNPGKENDAEIDNGSRNYSLYKITEV